MEKEQQTPKKKKTSPIVYIVVIILLLIIGVGLAFGFFVKHKVEEAIGGKVRFNTADNSVKIKTNEGETEISTNNSVSWPNNLPDVPKYESGKVKSFSHTTEGIWIITISETNENYFKQYKETLVNKGWKSDSEVNAGVSMAQLKKGDKEITLTFDASSKAALISINTVK